MRHSLLIHTTDPELFLILRFILEHAGHQVELAPNIGILLRKEPFAEPLRETVLVCLGMEDLLRTCALIRRHRPDINIVGFPLENQPIDGSGLDCFDYFVKRPFDPTDLLAFLRSGLRSKQPRHVGNTVTLSDVEIDVAAVRVRRGNADITLSALHFRLLLHLANNAGRVVSRDELIEACWPLDAIVEPRTVDIHVGRIRHALNQYGDDDIRTVRSIGYAARRVDQPDQEFIHR